MRAFTCACVQARARVRTVSCKPCRFEVQKEEQRWRCYDCRLVLEDLRVDRAKPASVQKRLPHKLAALVFHLAVRINGTSSPLLRDGLTLSGLKLTHHHAARAQLLCPAEWSWGIEPRCDKFRSFLGASKAVWIDDYIHIYQSIHDLVDRSKVYPRPKTYMDRLCQHFIVFYRAGRRLGSTGVVKNRPKIVTSFS